jgi:aminopeptidase N
MRASAAEEESLRTLTAQYGRTLVAGDLDALRKFWNPQSPNLAAQLRSYKNVFAQARLEFTSSDVTRLEPDIANKSVKGTVLIRFLIKSNNLTHVEFDCGDLTIDKVRLRGTTLQFAVNNRRLKISLPDGLRANVTHEIEVDYHGTPRRGIRFFPDREQVYTIFSTSHWMVCVDDPACVFTRRTK